MSISMPNEPIMVSEMLNLYKPLRRSEGNLEEISSFEHSSRTRLTITYAPDGRKLSDGLLQYPDSPEELWKESIVRVQTHSFSKAALENDTKKS
uniref:Uncharacterized protein n=1 Tax=Plectus sambesii TaxID=2011161 RepID=A0A914WA96_9BILA